MVKDEFDLIVDAITAVRLVRRECGSAHPAAERIHEIADHLEVNAARIAQGSGTESNILALRIADLLRQTYGRAFHPPDVSGI